MDTIESIDDELKLLKQVTKNILRAMRIQDTYELEQKVCIDLQMNSEKFHQTC